MRPDDFFIDDSLDLIFPESSRRFDLDMIGRLRAGPLPGHGDAEAAVALTGLVHDDLETFGTGGDGELTDDEMRQALVALKAVATRLGVPYGVPFRDFQTFRNWWIERGAAGSGGYQKRRNLLTEVFDPLHDQVADLETRALGSTLVEAVSPHTRIGWPSVDTEVAEIRRHFRSTITEQDYRSVGNDSSRSGSA